MLRIGLLVQDLATDYSSKIVQGTKKYCNEHNIQLFVFIVRSKNWKNGSFDYQHFACKSLATKYNIDGILLVTNTYCQNLPKEEHYNLIKELTYLPVVSFGAEVPGLSSVNVDAENSFRNLLNHLSEEHGCKNIYFMGPEKSTSKDILLRFRVYEEFMADKKQSTKDKYIYADYTFERAKIALKKAGISSNNIPFDAVVCCNDSMAFGCIDYLKEIGCKVPEQVKITGFDNQVRSSFSVPTLTSIDQCIEEQCYKAAELLHNEINNPAIEKQNVYVDARIIFRQSCGCNNTVLLEDAYEGRYFLLRNQLKFYHYYLQDLQAQVEQGKIMWYFKTFGIESCVCCFYDEPKTMQKNEDFVLPEKARVYLAYNKDKYYYYNDEFYLNPKEQMVPADFVFAENKEIIVTALFTREYQYGYMIYTPGEMDYNTYDLIVTTTGIALATNKVFTEKVHEQEKLYSEKSSLENVTYFDEMTTLLNRRGFFKYARSALNDSVERKLTGGIVFGDMDHLKLINDNYGHEAGDRAIKGVAEILQKVFRKDDFIARLGGDEFVIYSCGLSGKGFERIKNRLEEVTKKYNEEHQEEFEISISLGYVEFNSSNCDLESLMKKADEEQYKEKVLHHKNRN